MADGTSRCKVYQQVDDDAMESRFTEATMHTARLRKCGYLALKTMCFFFCVNDLNLVNAATSVW